MNKIRNFIQKALRIFSKNGGESENTKIFQDLPILSKEKYLNVVKMGDDETPIIVSEFNAKLFMLTDKRLVQKQNNIEVSILLSEVEKVNLNKKDFSIQRKNTWTELNLTISKNENITFEIESGLPFFGLWNILLFVEEHNRQV